MLATTKADIGDFFTAGIGIIAQRDRIVSVPQKDATGGTILSADEIFASAKAGQSDIAAFMDADIGIVRVQLDTGDSDTIKLVWSFARCIRPLDPGHGRMLQLIVGDTGSIGIRPVRIGDRAISFDQPIELRDLGIPYIDDTRVAGSQLARDVVQCSPICKARELDLAAGCAAETVVSNGGQVAVADDQRGAQSIRLGTTVASISLGRQRVGFQCAAVDHSDGLTVGGCDVLDRHRAFAGDIEVVITSKEAGLVIRLRTCGQVVHLHMGTTSGAKGIEARGNAGEVTDVIAERQSVVVPLAFIAIADGGIHAIHGHGGVVRIDDHTTTDGGIPSDDDAALGGTAAVRAGSQQSERGGPGIAGVIPGHDISLDGAARDTDVEIFDIRRASVERGTTSVDAAFDGATADSHVCLVYCGAGRAETVTIGIAARIDITFDGSVADNDIGRAIKGCIRLSLGKATADDITGLSAADLDMRTALHSAAGLAVRYSTGSLFVIVPG